MKTFKLLFFAMFLLPMLSIGQIRVDQNGHVGIGTVLTHNDEQLFMHCLKGGVYSPAIRIDANSVGSWKHIVTVDANNETVVAYRVTMGGNQGGANWYVTAGGWTMGLANYTTSDERVKENIEPIKSPYEILASLSGYTYKYKPEFIEQHGGSQSEEQFGLLAQEVEKVIPSAVTEDENGLKAVNYSSLIPVLLEVVKEQENRISKLETQVRLSKNDNDSELKPEVNNISISPNPASDVITISGLSKVKTDLSLNIYNLNGQEQLSKKFTHSDGSSTINISSLENGIYIFAVVSQGDIIKEEKIVVSD